MALLKEKGDNFLMLVKRELSRQAIRLTDRQASELMSLQHMVRIVIISDLNKSQVVERCKVAGYMHSD